MRLLALRELVMMMQDYTNQNVSTSQLPGLLLDWEPDIARFEREVMDAVARGTGDPLSLAEMECSLDLLDAEIAAWRRRSSQSDVERAAFDKLRSLRGKLTRLIDRLRPLTA